MSVRIVVCAKEVLDPDAVNNYALEGRLTIGDDGRTLTQTSIPRVMNAYDEQGIVAALRLREAGLACTITVVSVGVADGSEILKHAAALGADEIVAIPLDPTTTDHHGIARLLAAYLRSSGGAGIVLCGRQASDDDQGVVPALVGELLDMPVVTIAGHDTSTVSSPSGVTRTTRSAPSPSASSERATVTTGMSSSSPTSAGTTP